MAVIKTIKDETLTALGDAIRSKIIGTSEIPVLNVEKISIINKSEAYPYSLPDFVKKVKITGFITYFSPKEVDGGYEVGNVYGVYGLSMAVGNFGRYSGNSVRTHESCKVLFEGHNTEVIVPSKTVDFEIIIEGNKWAFASAQDSNDPEIIYVAFTAIGLDENGNEYSYTPLEMVDKINGLGTVPAEALTITGDCSYRFAYNGWNWLVNQYGDKITTKDITNLSYMFYSSNLLEEIPFDINIKNNTVNFNTMFYSNTKLKLVPYIIGPERVLPTSSYSHCLSLGGIFQHCHNFKYIPNDWFWKIVPNKDFWDKQATITTQSHATLFANCYSLREHPDISMLGGVWTSAYSNVYYNLFYCCSSLDKIENLLVLNNINSTSNYFNSTFSNCNRVKEITFETNEDGTPKTAKWKSQTIDLTNNIGYANGFQTNILNYNSGITEDKEVKDDATYQALKNDPDWFCGNINYSRYNHDSAVNTINSLPDTSAYGTNTIKFKGAAGALTDGGAINTLTEEEIAVAAAKGWTVSLV